MATTDRAEEAAPAAGVAASCRDADVVGLVGRPNGDALAGVGLLARACGSADIPFHARITDLGAGRDVGAESSYTLAIGGAAPAADHAIPPDAHQSASERAAAIAEQLGHVDPILAVAGRVAAGQSAVESPFADRLNRRPGVSIPTTDVADGLAHTTLVHAPFSGDPAAATAAIDDLDLPDTLEVADHRRVGSLLALAVVGDDAAPPRAATAVEGILRPHRGGHFETVGGTADVLDALARRSPGLGVATVLGGGDRRTALDAWRDRGRRVHRAVESIDLEARDEFAIGRIETSESTAVARLVRDFRSSAAAVLVVGPERIALASTADGPDAHAALTPATAEGHRARGTASLASTTSEDPSAAIAAIEEDR